MGLDMYFNKRNRKDEEIGYFRKFNALHQYITNYYSVEEDNCVEIELDREFVLELKNTLEQVIDDHELSSVLFPSASGFFFGSTNYDEFYYKDCEEALELCEKLLCMDFENDFIYYYAWY